MIAKSVLLALSVVTLAGQTPFPGAFRFQTLSIPGYSNFTPAGLNDRGDIVGSYRDTNNRAHGLFRTAAGAVALVDIPGATDTLLTAVNNNGDAVGYYYVADHARGFLRRANGTIVLRDVPGATDVRLYGISLQGRIAGTYDGHGLIFEADGTFNFFDVAPPDPTLISRGATAGATAYGIDDAGQIAGSWGAYLGGGIQLGGCFLRTPAGALTYASDCYQILGLNNNGLVISSLSPNGRAGLSNLAGRSVFAPATITALNSLNSIVGTGYNNGSFTATPCLATITPASQQIGPAGGTVTVQVSTDTGCAWSAAALPQSNPFVDQFTAAGSGNGAVTMTVPANTITTTERTQRFSIAGVTFTIAQSGAVCEASFAQAGTAFPYTGGSGGTEVIAPAGCNWTAASNVPWIQLSQASGSGNGSISYSVATNPGTSSRTGALMLGGRSFFINQAGSACTYTVTPATVSLPATGGAATVTVTTGPTCIWTASASALWVNGVPSQTITGSGSVSFTVGDNSVGNPRSTTLYVAGTAVSISQQGSTVSGLSFVPVPPCRLMDTRPSEGKTGPFGPPYLTGSATREIPVPSGSCSIPPYARAYSVNVTVVPRRPLSYLTLFPAGRAQPNSSTLNAFEGQIIANAAIVPAGTNGAINVFATDDTELILDINGYFTDPSTPNSLVFYPLAPCRLIDTRTGSGPFGPPSLAAGAARSFPVRASACSVPANAGAYALNVTLVPDQPIDYITAWPSGQPRPLVSVQNSPNGRVLANAAIVPAGTNGEISLFAPQSTNVVVDINGYFAPPGQPGGLRLYPVNPCRLADTRDGYGFTGTQGPPSVAIQTSRRFAAAGLCSVDVSARALSLNLTVVPPAYLGFVTLYPGPDRPFVSTLNAWEGQVAANAALVPADTAGGVTAYVSNTTNLILDVNGYFAP